MSYGITVWFTGLSGSGKTTLASACARALYSTTMHGAEVLDGDDLRTSLNNDLGFSKADREENIIRIAHVCKFLNSRGVHCVVSTISPYIKIQ